MLRSHPVRIEAAGKREKALAFVSEMLDEGATSTEIFAKLKFVGNKAYLRSVLTSPELHNRFGKYLSMRLQIEDKARIRHVLREFIDDRQLAAKLRIDACGKLLNMIDADRALSADGANKDTSNMTGDELRQVMNDIRDEMGRRASEATTISSEIIDNPEDDTPQGLDMFD